MTTEQTSTQTAATPPDWYPDPARRHHVRYFDGRDWTAHVGDAGVATEDPLGPVPIGLLGWPDPQLALRLAQPPVAVAIPRVKIWILAVASLMVFWGRVNDAVVVLPVGVGFAVWCWVMTAVHLREHRRAGNFHVVKELQAARAVATVCALIAVVAATTSMA